LLDLIAFIEKTQFMEVFESKSASQKSGILTLLPVTFHFHIRADVLALEIFHAILFVKAHNFSVVPESTFKFQKVIATIHNNATTIIISTNVNHLFFKNMVKFLQYIFFCVTMNL
jgi:hypothetical protein